jgi:hypothetical protein
MGRRSLPRRPAARRLRPWAAATAAVGGCLLAGCSSAAAPAAAPARPAAVTAPLATSFGGAGGRAWAIVAMGGSAADENLFWELFTRPAGSTQWTLVTPPGVADNGGLVAAGAAGQGLDVAFRPSQGLTFSPLALTGDGGKTWGTGLVDASVAAVPDALALGGGRMLALLGDGAIDQAATVGSGSAAATQPAASAGPWTRLAAPGAVAASPAGRACQVTGLTAVSVTASGTPLVAASCARPGVAGIFVPAGAGWRAAGPALTGRLAAQPVKVLRLTQYPASSGTAVGKPAAGKSGAGNSGAAAGQPVAGNIALLAAGTGSAASLVAAWTTDGTHWTVSLPLPAGGQVVASGAGPGATGAWVLLSGGRAESVAGPGAAWRALPAPPRGTAVLADGPAGGLDALKVSGGTLTVFQLTAAGAWREIQAISVPVEYGSSS